MKKSSRLLLALVVVLSWANSSALIASTTTWTGGTDTTWSHANWSAGVPGGSDVAQFSSSFSNQPNLGTTAASVGALYATTGLAQDVTISGTGAGTLTIVGNLTSANGPNGLANTGILMDDTANHNLTVNAPVAVSNSTSFVVNETGTLTIGGSLSIATGTTLTLGGNNAAGTTSITGVIASTTGKLTVSTAGQVILSATDLYSGATTVSAGTLKLSGFGGTVASSAITVSGGVLAIDSGSGTYASSVTRAAALTMNGGTLTIAGSSAGNTNDVVTGALSLSSATFNTITLTPNGSKGARLSAASLGGSGIALVNGTNLGSAAVGTAGDGNITFTTAPTSVGTTTLSGSTGADTTKNATIVPNLVGEVGTAPGSGGTQTGTANTFLTYDSTFGLRPLDLTNEYTNNSIVAGNNIRLASGTTTATSTASINSLVISGGNLTINTAITLTDASGAILFTTGNTIAASGTGTLAVGSANIIVNGGGITPTISAPISVSSGNPLVLAVGSGSTLTLSGGVANTVNAITAEGGGTVVLGGTSQTYGKTANYNFTVTGNSVVQYTDVAGDGLQFATFIINSGSVLDLAGGVNTKTLGLNGGGGVVKLTSGSLLIGSGAPSYTTTDTITGGKSLTVGGAVNTQTLSGTNNYAGGTTISTSGNGAANSILKISGGSALSDTGTVLIVATVAGDKASLDLAGSSETIGSLSSAISGTGTVNNDIIGNSSTSTNSTLTINTAVSGNATFGGVIQDKDASSTGNKTMALVKKGISTETLSGLNTYTGGTTVNNGTLLLDLSTNTTNVLASGGAITLGGGTLAVSGASTGSSSQSLGNLTLSASTGSGIIVNKNGGSSTTLTLGNTWTRGAGATLNINLSAGGVLMSNPSVSNNLVGTTAYATVTDAGGTGFATVSGGNVVRYTGATVGLPTSGSSSSTNYSTSGTETLTASEAVNSLALDTSSTAESLDLGTTTLTLTSGGLLMTGSNNAVIQNGQLGASGAEVIVQQFGAGSLTINGTISGGAGSLTKAGPGLLVLGATNSYSGGTNLNGGVLNFSSLSNLGTGAINFGGGTLQYAAGNTADITSRTVTLAGADGTIDTNGNNVTFANGIGGTGGLAKNGAGILTLAGVNTYSGDTTLNQGTLLLDLSTNTTGVVNSASALLLNGGGLNIKGASSGASSQTLGGLAALAGGSNIVVNNNGGSGVALTINNTWTRTAGAALNFDLSSSSGNVLQSQTVSNTNGIVGGWLTITDSTGTGFATYNDVAANITNPIIRYTGATAITTTSDLPTGRQSVNFTTSAASLTFGATSQRAVNSLALNTASNAVTWDMGGASDILTITSGGLLMTGANNATLQDGQYGAANAELIVQQYGTGTMTISGTVSSGSGSLTKAGPGKLVLTGANSYTGPTIVDGGTLVATNTTGSATGSGALSVLRGAALAGTGTSSGTSFAIGGTNGSGAASIYVGQSGATGDTNTTSNLTLLGSGASTIANANLTFNLNTTAGGGNELLVGSTAITFGSGTAGSNPVTLTLNLQGGGTGGSIPYFVLIAGNVGTPFTSQYSGLSLGTSFAADGGLLTPILNSGVGGSGNLILALNLNGSPNFYGGQAGLYLFQTSGGIDDIVVIPEPGTWALMLGGLAVLIFWQRRKNKLDR